MKCPRNGVNSSADITKIFEQRLLRGHWCPYRRKIGIKTRHPKEQPDTFTVTFEYPSGHVSKEEISPDEYPFLLVCDFDPPSLLAGTIVTGTPVARVFMKLLVDGNDMPHMKRPGLGGPPRLTVDVNFDVEDFVRSLRR
jgi:hypothetical protein